MATASQIKNGYHIVRFLLITIAVMSTLGFIAQLTLRGFDLLAAAQYAFTLWMCWSTYIGKVWARALLAVLLLIGGVASLIGALHPPLETGLLIAGLLEIAFAAALFTIPAVNAYFDYAAQQSSS